MIQPEHEHRWIVYDDSPHPDACAVEVVACIECGLFEGAAGTSEPCPGPQDNP